MARIQQGKIRFFVLISLFLILLPGRPTKVFPASPSSGQSSSSLDRIETPPMPGQVYKGPGQKAEDVDSESLPPAVKKMDEQIKRETEILRKGFGEREQVIESEPGSKPKGTESKPESRSLTPERRVREALPKATPMTGKEPVATTGRPTTIKRVTRPDSHVPSSDKPTGIINKKAEPQMSPSPKSKAVTMAEPTSVKTKAQTESESRVKGGKEYSIGFFLKRLIIFVIIVTIAFFLMRRYVFKS